MTKNSKKYGFKAGETFSVLRNIRFEVVVIISKENTPNIIWSQKRAEYYGKLTGTPVLGG